MANFLAPIINDQQENSNGAPLSGGTIEVYLAGSSTPATTYSDQAGANPNTWPIVLNTLGVNNQGAVWLTGGFTYKFVIKDSTGVVQRTIDNVAGINDSVGALDQWVVSVSIPTFVSATSFTLVGDQTQIFQIGRRIKTTKTGGTIYTTISGSVYGAPNTTVTVRNDSGVLDSGLSQVSYGIISGANTSLPGGQINYGQCKLTKSGANLLLSPFNGNRITINGAICVIPAAGVTLAPTALAVGANFYIYAFMSGATLTLEASATGHSTDAATGVEIKTGDATRALVGFARTIAGPAWQDTASQRFVLSWFNRDSIDCSSALTAATGNVGGAYTEISTLLRCEILHWANTAAAFNFSGTLANNVIAGPNQAFSSFGVDGGVSDGNSGIVVLQAGVQFPVACSYVLPKGPAEGYPYVTLMARQTAVSTSTYAGGGTPGDRCVNVGVIQG